MAKRGFLIALAILGLGLFMSCSSDSGGDDDTPGDGAVSFTGTWLDTVSATESYKYVYKDDKTFTYTWVTANMTTVYTGTFIYDEATKKYTETVQTQAFDGGAPTQGGWDKTYSYTLSATTLAFDDGAGYAPSFTKQ